MGNLFEVFAKVIKTVSVDMIDVVAFRRFSNNFMMKINGMKLFITRDAARGSADGVNGFVFSNSGPFEFRNFFVNVFIDDGKEVLA